MFVDLSIFMITTQNSDSWRMFNFENQYIKEGFNTVEPSVNIISHEQVVCILN